MSRILLLALLFRFRGSSGRNSSWKLRRLRSSRISKGNIVTKSRAHHALGSPPTRQNDRVLASAYGSGCIPVPSTSNEKLTETRSQLNRIGDSYENLFWLYRSGRPLLLGSSPENCGATGTNGPRSVDASSGPR